MIPLIEKLSWFSMSSMRVLMKKEKDNFSIVYFPAASATDYLLFQHERKWNTFSLLLPDHLQWHHCWTQYLVYEPVSIQSSPSSRPAYQQLWHFLSWLVLQMDHNLRHHYDLKLSHNNIAFVVSFFPIKRKLSASDITYSTFSQTKISPRSS